MSDISRLALFGKLNPLSYGAIESATTFCKMRGNPYVELSHWLHQLLRQDNSDVATVLGRVGVDAGRLAADLTRSLDALPRGASSISDLSVHVEESVERAWVYASLLFANSSIRSGHILLGWLKTPSLRNNIGAISKEFLKVSPDVLATEFDRLTAGSVEAIETQADAGAADPQRPSAPAMGGRQALEKYSVDLVEQNRGDNVDPIVGRDEEIRQLIFVLLRRRQNNPILTGEAGVGKTAVVEGLAQRIARGEVPPALEKVQLRALDVALLQAGAGVKGEFESRLRQVIDEVKASDVPIILFVDETHTLVGAGGAAGTGDAANLLKPALARGELRTIGATTWTEYKKHIESDPALSRRFQRVDVKEPTTEGAIAMLRAGVSRVEQHHRVQVLDEALEAAVHLSKRFIVARQLPDKAVSLLDTACARVAVSQHGVPADIEDARRRVAALVTEREIVSRELRLGVGDEQQVAKLDDAIGVERARCVELEERWSSEKALVDDLLSVRAKLRDATDAEESGGSEELLAQQRKLCDELQALQGEVPMVFPTVDEQAIAAVVSDWTGIPAGRMAKSVIESVLGLRQELERRVVGQSHALEMIQRRVQTSRAGLENPGKPVGVFLLAGPSGVGKTETAMGLGEALYGGEENVITINMSEFQEAHSVSSLKGAPPGYVGFGEGGVLTEAVRRRPHSVVLLDEIEKAHSDVHELFFQVFDKGWMEDGQGVRVDFRNTVILLTSNAGSETIMRLCAKDRPDSAEVAAALRPDLARVFPAALIGRMVVVPYYPLNDSILTSIVQARLKRISDRLRDQYSVAFHYDDAAVEYVLKRCTTLESGARMIDAVLTNTVLPDLSRELLVRTLEGRQLTGVTLTTADDGFQYKFD
jgi:type VI secretion system protein VasG